MGKQKISPEGFVITTAVAACILGTAYWSEQTVNVGGNTGHAAESLVQDTFTAYLLEEEPEENAEENGDEKDYIKWVEFHVTSEAMKQAYQYDLDTYDGDVHLNWVDLLAYLGAKYGGDFSRYRSSDLAETAEKLQMGELSVKELEDTMEYFAYYREAYGAVLDGMVGEYRLEQSDGSMKSFYGLKAFNPIAKGFPYSDYDDFGVSRSYGYRRNHLGHDMMGQVGTPVIAVESGVISALGWNQYGGWRIGIDSFDKKRYYYYAHLRQNYPYAEGLEEGSYVTAGDVIGYMGHTGYSATENVNNIDVTHLHFGMEIIFDESQKDSDNEIWIDCYELTKFLYQNQSAVEKIGDTREWKRVYDMDDSPIVSP